MNDERAWVSDALKVAWHEVLLYLRTFAGITFRPARFAADWPNGRETMNPLGFVASSVTIITLLSELISRINPEVGADERSLAFSIIGALGPYLFLIVLGALVHGILRLGASRRYMHGSIAVALYSGAGPGLAPVLLVLGVIAFLTATTGPLHDRGILVHLSRMTRLLFLLALSLLTLWQYVAFGRALRSFHRARWYSVAGALTSALVAISFGFGFLHRVLKVGSLGWMHPLLWWRDGHISIDFYF